MIIRAPELQHKSWWRLESNAIAWGGRMGMGDRFLVPGYPPKSLQEAFTWSQSSEARGGG